MLQTIERHHYTNNIHELNMCLVHGDCTFVAAMYHNNKRLTCKTIIII